MQRAHECAKAAVMLDVEAARLCQILLCKESVSPLLNLGSSTREFREVTKPHIERNLFEPLRRAGVAVFHSDLKDADGVDIPGDALNPAVMRDLKAREFKCILVANLLEHVRDRQRVAAACEDIVGSGGLILVTVPSSYPYHADPIDTYYRPSPAELPSLFRHSRIILTEQLVGLTYAEELEAREANVWTELARTILWSLVFFARPRSFASRVHRWLWYFRPYCVSIALLRVR